MPRKKKPGPEKPGRGVPHKADEYKKNLVRRYARIKKTQKETMEAVGLANKQSFEKHYGEIWREGRAELDNMTHDVMLALYDSAMNGKVYAQIKWMEKNGWYDTPAPEMVEAAHKAFNAINFNALAPGQKAPESPEMASQVDNLDDFEEEEGFTH